MSMSIWICTTRLTGPYRGQKWAWANCYVFTGSENVVGMVQTVRFVMHGALDPELSWFSQLLTGVAGRDSMARLRFPCCVSRPNAAARAA